MREAVVNIVVAILLLALAASDVSATVGCFKSSNGTDLTSSGKLDVHTQRHVWSVFDGERERWRMPVAGEEISSAPTSGPWRSWIIEERDAAGNLISQRAVPSETSEPVGGVVARSVARGAGRLALRERSLASEGWARTSFAYAEAPATPASPEIAAVTPAPGARTGLLGRARTEANGVRLGGSEVTRDEALRILFSSELGLGHRTSEFGYDDRGRLRESKPGVLAEGLRVPQILDRLDAADFRLERTVDRLTASERELLGSIAGELEGWSWTATPNDAHQIARMRFEGRTPSEWPFQFEGGRRADDTEWRYRYDELGRLVRRDRIAAASGETPRYDYEYDGNNRLVGRRACQNADESPCELETRSAALSRDGLPADTTFVWDPIADRLLAIYEAGASTPEGSAPEHDAGLLRQYVHGDQGYDDLLEVLAAGPGGAAPTRYLPLFDEAGSGSLLAVVSEEGNLEERVLYGDAYGDQPRYLHGPVCDRITLEAAKNGLGEIERVQVTAHFSEQLVPGSVSEGIRIRALDGGGNVLRTAPPLATVLSESPYAALITLDRVAWAELTGGGAVTLEIAVTAAVRSQAWGETPVMRAPPYTVTLFGVESSTETPLALRESLATLQAELFDKIAPGSTSRPAVLYEVPDLYLAASEESRTRLLTGFKGAPFVEPATGLVYLRDRWYDPETGSFLTPDRAGYLDSSNLYAGFAGDPVNKQDPTGEYIEVPIELISLGIGGVSLAYNVSQGNWGMAAWDAFGIAVDTVGLVVPGTLAVGASTQAVRAGHKLSRAQKLYLGAQATQQAGDAAFGLYEAGREYQQGNPGWGTFYLGMSAFGLHGAKQNVMEVYPVDGYGLTRTGLAPGVRQKAISKTETVRWEPGVVRGGERLPRVTGQWLDSGAGPIPGQIAEQLRGRRFKNFKAFREEFWRLVAVDEILSAQFKPHQLSKMRSRGLAPTAPGLFHVGRGPANRSFNLDHINPLGEALSPDELYDLLYDLDNLQVVAPYWNQIRK